MRESLLEPDLPETDVVVEFAGRELRPVAWMDAIEAPASAPPAASAAGICHATIGLVHEVPEPLRHIGCMWLEEGDEERRCGRRAAWTMGSTLRFPRLYCEEHGLRILAHRLRESRIVRASGPHSGRSNPERLASPGPAGDEYGF